jgi:acyl-CoA reductase-like NAD-dependent aldehyde dehydrogenase
MLIGGKWVDSVSGEWLEVEDPAHRRPVAEVPRGRYQDVACAVKSRVRCLSRLGRARFLASADGFSPG